MGRLLYAAQFACRWIFQELDLQRIYRFELCLSAPPICRCWPYCILEELEEFPNVWLSHLATRIRPLLGSFRNI